MYALALGISIIAEVLDYLAAPLFSIPNRWHVWCYNKRIVDIHQPLEGVLRVTSSNAKEAEKKFRIDPNLHDREHVDMNFRPEYGFDLNENN